MILTIDFETRSECDLKTAGPWKYAEHPSTRILCLGIKVDGFPANLWWPEWTGQEGISLSTLADLLKEARYIYAHNAEFETAMWGLMPIPLPLEKVRCTAAMAAYHALPRSLDNCAKALGLSAGKDAEGYKLMMKMCKPQKERKTGEKFWIEDSASLQRLGEYCKQDCEVEYEVCRRLRQLPEMEQEVWRVDQIINRRGVAIDTTLVREAMRVGEEQQDRFKAEMKALVGCSPNQVAEIVKWVNAEGAPLNELTKDSVLKALAGELPPKVRRVLEIRQSSARTSAKKYAAMEKRVSADGRARSLFMYHAATTGRWGGKSIQPQNMPSRGVISDPDEAIKVISRGASAEEIEFLWGDTMQVLSSCTRGAIIAPPGKDLICSDYSAIEGRVLAWVAGEEFILEAYRNGDDLYKIAASVIYHKPKESITKAERQIGKISELSSGYSGGHRAFTAMAKGYGIDEIPEDEAKEIVKAWRENRPKTVAFWRDIQTAAMNAIENPGSLYICQKTIWGVKDGYLCCKLPGGRTLRYPNPSIGEKIAPWDTEKTIPVINFWGVDINNHWTQLETYGGRLTENVVQAIARDLLAEAMVRIERHGKYQIVLHIHDEICSEVIEGKGDLEEYNELLTRLPAWAIGLPLEAEGWIGKRYKK